MLLTSDLHSCIPCDDVTFLPVVINLFFFFTLPFPFFIFNFLSSFFPFPFTFFLFNFLSSFSFLYFHFLSSFFPFPYPFFIFISLSSCSFFFPFIFSYLCLSLSSLLSVSFPLGRMREEKRGEESANEKERKEERRGKENRKDKGRKGR